MRDNMIFAIILVIGVIGAVTILIVYFPELFKPKDYKTPCKEMCNKFNYTFLRIEDVSSFGNPVAYDCWCIKQNNEPINLGTVP